jgi:hypothetical protein
MAATKPSVGEVNPAVSDVEHSSTALVCNNCHDVIPDGEYIEVNIPKCSGSGFLNFNQEIYSHDDTDDVSPQKTFNFTFSDCLDFIVVVS